MKCVFANLHWPREFFRIEKCVTSPQLIWSIVKCLLLTKTKRCELCDVCCGSSRSVVPFLNVPEHERQMLKKMDDTTKSGCRYTRFAFRMCAEQHTYYAHSPQPKESAEMRRRIAHRTNERTRIRIKIDENNGSRIY